MILLYLKNGRRGSKKMILIYIHLFEKRLSGIIYGKVDLNIYHSARLVSREASVIFGVLCFPPLSHVGK